MENNNSNEYNTFSQQDKPNYYYKKPPKAKIPWYQSCLIPFLASIIGTLLVLALFLGGSKILEFFNPDKEEAQITKAPSNEKGGNTKDEEAKGKSVSSMIKNTSPSIVGVINKQKASGIDSFLNREGRGGSNESEETGTGSGVIYQVNGNTAYIVTNNHVIEKASEIEVRLHNDKTVKAELVGTDVMTDLAVLKIKGDFNIKPISFADSSKVKAGETVYALGNPLGIEFANSVTEGIISSEERTMQVETSEGITEATVIQTDAAINPGNSGGALIDLNGNLIGINSMKISRPDVEGIGFAIPSNEVNHIIKDIMDDGKVTRPYIGISMVSIEDIPKEYLSENNIKEKEGVFITNVDKRANNKIKKGDIIQSIDDNEVKDASDIREYVYKNKKPGDTVTFKVVRDEAKETIKVKLKEQQ